MSTKEDRLDPTTLHEAINIIKFLKATHKQEISQLKKAYEKQSEFIKKLESSRKKELEYLSKELKKYEMDLIARTQSVTAQLAEKDEIIQQQMETIEELRRSRINSQDSFVIPEINIQTADSNSDSGIALDESLKIEKNKTESKTVRRCRRFADSIGFLRRVDFSPIKYKPRESKKKEDNTLLEVKYTDKRLVVRQLSEGISHSDDDRYLSSELALSDSGIEQVMLRPKKMNDSMNNHFSDDGSEDTSEEAFDRVMTRSSIRRSVKVNPKYKKINRAKSSKLLEHVKVNLID